MIHRGARHSESANSEMFSRSTDRTAGGDDPSSPSSARKSSPPVQKTGPINARLPNIAKTRESNPLENLRTAPRCGGGGRGKPRREREATRVGRSKIALARSVGAETGGVASLRPWQIAIYEQWASIVKKRHVTSAVFAVRALCFPLPLCFHPFSEGKEREARPLLFQHDSSLLFSRLHLAPSRNWLFAAIILPEWSHAGREGESGRGLHARCVDWKGRLETTRWHDRGNVGERRKGSRWRKIRRRCRRPLLERFSKKGPSFTGSVPQGWRKQRKSLRSSSAFSVNLEISLARVFPSIWTVRSVVFARFFISLENFSSIDFGRKRFLLQYVRWFFCDIYQERVTIIFICEKKISRTYIFWFLFGW